MTPLRPFGDVILDGVDLENESGNGSYYDTFLGTLTDHFKEGPSRSYHISALPMCGEVAKGEHIAIPTSIMKYWIYRNIGQELGSSWFSDDIKNGDTLLSTVSPSPKLIVAIPRGKGAAGDGPDMQTADQISKSIADIKGMSLKSFGGINMWDAGRAAATTGFSAAVKPAL